MTIIRNRLTREKLNESSGEDMVAFIRGASDAGMANDILVDRSMDVKDYNLSNVTIKRGMFDGVKGVRTNIARAELSECLLPNLELAECDLTQAVLKASILKGLCVSCDFSDADFSETKLNGIVFDRCNFTDASFVSASFVGCTFRACQFTSLAGATGFRPHFEGCNFTNVDVRGFTARGTTFDNCTGVPSFMDWTNHDFTAYRILHEINPRDIDAVEKKVWVNSITTDPDMCSEWFETKEGAVQSPYYFLKNTRVADWFWSLYATLSENRNDAVHEKANVFLVAGGYR